MTVTLSDETVLDQMSRTLARIAGAADKSLKIYGLYPCVAHGMRRLISMKARELEKKFDAGQSIKRYLDLSKAKRPNQEQKRVNVDFPLWMIHALDKEAKRLGVPRQSIIKIWLAERLDKTSS